MNKKPSKEKKGMTTEEAIKKYLGNAEISKSSLDLVKELKELSKPIRGFEKITNIEFIEKKSELIVNQMRIKIGDPSKQYYLCKMLCKNNKNLQKKFEVADFNEVYGDKVTKKTLYQTVRHLNIKIMKSTGIQGLIQFKRGRIFININKLNA